VQEKPPRDPHPRVQLAAEEAEQRAARLRGDGQPSSPAPSPKPAAKSASEALRLLEEKERAEEEARQGRRFSREFKTFALDKPMGMVLEENHESVGGVLITSVTEGSNAEKLGVQVRPACPAHTHTLSNLLSPQTRSPPPPLARRQAARE
jgi:hypothetical protein